VVKTVWELLDGLHPETASHEKLITFVKDRPEHNSRYSLCVEKMKEETGRGTGIKFEEGMRKTVEWYLMGEDWLRDKIKYMSNSEKNLRKYLIGCIYSFKTLLNLSDFSGNFGFRIIQKE